jgi:hypothetical protein
VENYYEILGVGQDATHSDIKKAFRARAKRVHPDIAGAAAQADMRRLLTAYETLSDTDRRGEYDRAYFRFVKNVDFDYRTFLKARPEDPESQAKLVFFDLLHLEEEEAIEVWRRNGGIDFRLDVYLEREDWMDCAFILAEELDKRQASYEAFILLVELVREERRRPYFRHFMPEVDLLVKEIARVRLYGNVEDEVLVECLEDLIDLGYSKREEARWLRSIAEALERMGDFGASSAALREALRRDATLPGVVQIRRRLGV